MKGPWKWSENGLELLDGSGRTVLKIRPSDATEEEFAAVEAVPELVEALIELLQAEGQSLYLAAVRKAEAVLAKIGKE